ncbi:MAG: IS1634 family transposase, partial [Actinomycetes bacterium]
MFLREVKRQNKNGTQASYLQLVHNQWDPAAQASRTKILYSFGRTDQVERAAIGRLIASLSRLLDPATAFTATASSELTFLEARPLGGAHLLDGMWHRLGIDQEMATLLKGRRRDPRVERVLFALVANRALDASSKLAAAGWVTSDVHIGGLPATSDDACYRAMDWLLEIAGDLEKAVFWQVATLLDLEVDLLFFDTTSTYFQLDEPDAPIARDQRGMPVPDPDGDASTGDGHGTDGEGDGAATATTAGFRSYGHSKDHRDDLPQIVVGMAVTRTGIPVRVWCWPGSTSDQVLIRQVKDDLRDWT